MKKALVFFIFLASLSKIYSQELPIIWGEPQKSSGSLIDILPKNTKDFVTLRWSGGNTFGSYKLNNFADLTFLEEKKMKLRTQSGIGTFETSYFFGNRTCVFLSDFANNRMMIFLQKYDDYLDPEDEPILMADYENRKFNAQPNFQITKSNNNKFISIFWQIPGKSSTSDAYGYKIFDANFNEVQAGEYALPFDGNLTIITNYHLTNNGECLISLTEFIKPVDRLFINNNSNFKAVHVYKLKNNILKEFSLELEGMRIEEMQLGSNDSSSYNLIGIYAKANSYKSMGIFSLIINAQKDSLSSSVFIPLNTVSAGDKWADNDQNNRQGFGRNITAFNPDNYTYKLRDVFTLNDGSILGSIEEYYMYRRVSADNRGISSSVNYYYYDDIIAFKINDENSLDWETRIKKSQISVNDQGAYSSYSSFYTDSSFCFIFNDNSNNYDEFGVYTRGNSKPQSTNFSRQRNTSAICQINKKDGGNSRKILFDKKELNALIVPKAFKLDIAKQELLLYALQGFKEKFGIFKLNTKK
jgi:hypothetical protein